jgi:hypothetical protein
MIKSKDIATLVLLVGISAIFAFFVSRVLFGNQKSLVTRVEVVDPVSSNFDYENKPYFGKDKINPTKDITIDENNNTKPLGQ